jgi:hypothetical protein
MAMVSLIETGAASQMEVARAFGFSTRQIRRFQRPARRMTWSPAIVVDVSLGRLGWSASRHPPGPRPHVLSRPQAEAG